LSENWSSGYVTELDYTHGFYNELAPSHLRFAALSKGFRSHTDIADGITYCELGCGQGFTANVLAAANPEVEFYATDFNPAHTYNAQRLANEASLPNVHFFDDSFAEFEQRTDLPQFNVISLHGIYSWVAKEHRDTIVRFIDRRLKPGGLVYISYNCLPGWAGPSPIQHLIRMHTEKGSGSLTDRVDSAVEFLEKLQEDGARYFKYTPKIEDRINSLKGKDKNYLAHEYLNGEWRAFYHSEVVKDLSSARLTYISNSDILHHIDDINLTPAQLEILNTSTDNVLRETIHDYILNRQFRKDVFARGAVALTNQESREAWLDSCFALSLRGEDVPMKTKAALGDVSLQQDVYGPVIHAFEAAGGYAFLREVVKDKAIAGLGWTRLQRIIRMLISNGSLIPCPTGTTNADQRRESTARLNKVIIKQAVHSSKLKFLASPVTGNGVRVDRLHQIFLLAQQETNRSPAAYAWSIFKQQGQSVNKDGKILKTDEESIADLTERHANFIQKTLPVLNQLGIA
jgi:SAM-dependent methyltransferase